MSCYFRHMKDILDEAGVVITKENKKEIDRIIHNLVNVEYKNCPTTWRPVKERIKGDEEARRRFITMLTSLVLLTLAAVGLKIYIDHRKAVAKAERAEPNAVADANQVDANAVE